MRRPEEEAEVVENQNGGYLWHQSKSLLENFGSYDNSSEPMVTFSCASPKVKDKPDDWINAVSFSATRPGFVERAKLLDMLRQRNMPLCKGSVAYKDDKERLLSASQSITIRITGEWLPAIDEVTFRLSYYHAFPNRVLLSPQDEEELNDKSYQIVASSHATEKSTTMATYQAPSVQDLEAIIEAVFKAQAKTD